jgi:hypothetical protein
MGFAGYLVVLWLAADRALYAGAPAPSLWMPVVLNAGIGALFGSTVPHWYRSVARSVRTSRLLNQKIRLRGSLNRTAQQFEQGRGYAGRGRSASPTPPASRRFSLAPYATRRDI